MMKARTRNTTLRRPGRAFRAILSIAVLVGILLTVIAPKISDADEGYDMMRIITSQWLKPFMYIVIDKSGSMAWTFDDTNSTWDFRTLSGVNGNVTMRNDWSDGYHGVGQGYWLRVGSFRILAEPPTEWVYDSYTWNTGWADHDYPSNIYSPKTEPAIAKGELIEITNYPISGVNGIYLCSQESRSSGHNPGWYYTAFYKMNADGSFEDSAYSFPLNSGSGDARDVKPYTFRRVRLKTTAATLHASGDRDRAKYLTSSQNRLWIDEDLDVTAGDIVRITGFSTTTNNGTFFLRRYISNSSGYDSFAVSKMQANGNFPNSEFVFSGSSNDTSWNDRAEIMYLDYTLGTQWYFVPATRIAVTKNVWGSDLTVYEPSIDPTGTDSRHKQYYTFNGSGPINGAWLEWTGPSDDGYGKAWHNWSSSMGIAPVGDPNYTTEQAPSRMTERFGELAHLGLILYSGGCNNSITPETTLDPVQSGSNISKMNSNFERRVFGGIVPGGSTPTKGALTSSGKTLTTAYNADIRKRCGRTYGVLLMTDGESNNCNPSNSSWSSCPNSYTSYPAGASDNLWKQTVSGHAMKIRTWAIGISKGIGRCELNYTAYKGRTDATSPNGDSGMSIDDDPYLTEGNGNVYNTAHGDYAFFANSVDELRNALLDIISSMGVGDYTTSAPAVSGSATYSGPVGLIPSSDYPSWKGHFRAFHREGVDPNTGLPLWTEFWDAGDVLTTGNEGMARRIYTWKSNHDLVPVTDDASSLSAMNVICNNCGMDSAVVDFIRGNDGSGNSRSWKLGALLHTTPAVISAPEHWKQGEIQSHHSFEMEYGSRRTMVWVGSSDGMIHGFDVDDGAEIIALIPPDLLERQVTMYSQYLADPTKSPMGQLKSPGEHVYGVANSIRTADIWDSSIQDFRTVIIVTEGPGGTGIHAIDVTHPFPGRTVDSVAIDPDPNYDSSQPVTVLWSRSQDGAGGTIATANLGNTWSIPAIGVEEIDQQSAEGYAAMLFSEGWKSNENNNLIPSLMMIDPVDGSIDSTHQLANRNSPLVGNQAFANSTLWTTTADTFKPDNLADQGVQADLNGHVFALSGNNWATRTLLFNVGADQPIYYSPSVGTYPAGNPEYDIFTFGSGSYYEISEKVTGSSATIVPKVYLGTRTLADGSTTYKSLSITGIDLPNGATLPNTSPAETTFSDEAQLLAPTMLLTPAEGSNLKPLVFYLVYDPLGGECVGKSYIIKIKYDPAKIAGNEAGAVISVDAYEAGEGAAGGFAIAGQKVIVSQSGVGEGAKAHIYEIPDLTIPSGNTGKNNVRWWMELQ